MNISHFDFNFFKAKIYFQIVIPLLLLLRFDNLNPYFKLTIIIKNIIKNIIKKISLTY